MSLLQNNNRPHLTLRHYIHQDFQDWGTPRYRGSEEPFDVMHRSFPLTAIDTSFSCARAVNDINAQTPEMIKTRNLMIFSLTKRSLNAGPICFRQYIMKNLN